MLGDGVDPYTAKDVTIPFSQGIALQNQTKRTRLHDEGVLIQTRPDTTQTVAHHDIAAENLTDSTTDKRTGSELGSGRPILDIADLGVQFRRNDNRILAFDVLTVQFQSIGNVLYADGSGGSGTLCGERSWWKQRRSS